MTRATTPEHFRGPDCCDHCVYALEPVFAMMQAILDPWVIKGCDTPSKALTEQRRVMLALRAAYNGKPVPKRYVDHWRRVRTRVEVLRGYAPPKIHDEDVEGQWPLVTTMTEGPREPPRLPKSKRQRKLIEEAREFFGRTPSAG